MVYHFVQVSSSFEGWRKWRTEILRRGGRGSVMVLEGLCGCFGDEAFVERDFGLEMKFERFSRGLVE